MSEAVRNYDDLRVWQQAFDLAMKVFTLSKSFPATETYALTDQVRRSSRSVTANIAEAWHKRHYPAAFVLKLTDAAAEAAESQVWLRYATSCGYIPKEQSAVLGDEYGRIIKTLDAMMLHAQDWCRPWQTVRIRGEKQTEGSQSLSTKKEPKR